jgi:hypothetical protein
LALSLVGGLLLLSTQLATGATATASTVSSTVPIPSIAKGGHVDSSSCVAGPVCVSLGWNHHGNHGFAWAVRWQGKKWSKLTAPFAGVLGDGGTAVLSCATSTWCMATGSKAPGVGNHPVAAVLNGEMWTSIPVPTPKGATDFSLSKLKCLTSRWCVAVGSYVANKPNYVDATFLTSEVWNGSTWHNAPIFSPRTDAAQVDPGMVAGGDHPTASPQQLSCVTKNLCFIMGFWRGVFVEKWNGKHWRQIAAPNDAARPPSDSEFSGGSCISKSFCVATGGYAVSNGKWSPLIEQWNGHSWSIVTLPKLPPKFLQKPGFRLNQVTCSSSTSCVAYGDPGFGTTGLNGLKWNGAKWLYISTGRGAVPTILCVNNADCETVD